MSKTPGEMKAEVEMKAAAATEVVTKAAVSRSPADA